MILQLFLVLLATPPVAISETSPTLAIVDFNDVTKPGRRNSRDYDKNALSLILMESLAEALQVEYRLVEREKLEAVKREQDLVLDNRVDPKTAAKVGKIIGADFLLTGTVTEMAIEKNQFKYGEISMPNNRYRLTVVFKILDTTTSEIVVAGKESVITNSRLLKRKGMTETFYLNELATLVSESILLRVQKAFREHRERMRDQREGG